MITRLPYGKTFLNISIPEDYCVSLIEPAYIAGLPDPVKAIRASLQNPINSLPLAEMGRPDDRIGIIFNDITRPTPNKDILKAVLAELPHIPSEKIVLFNALGTHRPNTEKELRGLLGNEIVDNYRIVQNNCVDPDTQVNIGVTGMGHEIWLNRELWACDLKILTGFIEPHFFAGYSGGGKAIMPGMAGQATIFGNHEARMIGHPNATWGKTWGNPIWEEILEVATKAGRTFLLNVTLNKNKEITEVFSGDLNTAHAHGCEYIRRSATIPVHEPFDIILTTNSGYPLDMNLYQAVKGMSAAAQVVRPGGTIIIAAECSDGLPGHGLYAQLLRSCHSPRAFLEDLKTQVLVRQDQWQIQIQAQILCKADVFVYSHFLSDEQILSALFKPSRNIEITLKELLKKYGQGTRICVLPEGPQTIPFLAKVR